LPGSTSELRFVTLSVYNPSIAQLLRPLKEFHATA
jgi:hypothetical protein